MLHACNFIQSEHIMRTSLKNLKYDLPAGVVVFLVALPLCLGIALASGAPLFSGVISGIIGGIVVSTFSNSPLGVSGPAAGLAAIVLSSIKTLGSFEMLLLAVVFAGLLQIILGFLRAGVIAYFFPSSVIKGMLAAIGILIILKQLPHAMGYDRDYEGDFSFWQINGENTFSSILNAVNYITIAPITIALVSLAIIMIWELKPIKNNSILKYVPGPLVVVIAGVLLNRLFTISFPEYALRPDQHVILPVASTLPEFFSQFTLPDFSAITNTKVYLTAATLAIVASIETLLCVEATDKLDPQKRITSPNRELRAQGIANVISGMVGGLPITQVIVRSSANIQAGGRTRMSAMIHGILLFASALLFPGLLNMIPLASLAAILLAVGYKLAKPSMMKIIYRTGWKQFLPFATTIIAIVLTDLLIGIGIGLAVSFFFILRNNYKTPYFFRKESHGPQDPIRIELSEDVSFLNKASILSTLSHIPANSYVIIDASRSIHIDDDVIEIIQEFRHNAAARNIRLELINLPEQEKSEKVHELIEKVKNHVLELTHHHPRDKSK